MVADKEFRVSYGKNINKQKKQKFVAPFSQAMPANTQVIPPPRIYVFRERKIKPTLFRKYFNRGDLPISREYRKNMKSSKILMWKLPIDELDYSCYLPIFFDGLAESIFPYALFARCAVNDMLAEKNAGDKILPIIPRLIIPIKNALNTRNREVILATLTAIRNLLKTGPYIGEALVPYFRQILPIFNLMRNVNVNIGDKIDFCREPGHVGDKVETTLNMMELCGGVDAFINIKYMVPTYESCVHN